MNGINQEIQFLMYKTPTTDIKVEAVIKDETLRLTQKSMSKLFDVQIPAINKHLKNIFDSGELDSNVVISKMEITNQHGAINGKFQTNNVHGPRSWFPPCGTPGSTLPQSNPPCKLFDFYLSIIPPGLSSIFDPGVNNKPRGLFFNNPGGLPPPIVEGKGDFSSPVILSPSAVLGFSREESFPPSTRQISKNPYT